MLLTRYPLRARAARVRALPGRAREEPQRPERAETRVSRRGKFIAGGLVIVAAIAYLILAGVSQSVVYFVTPSELLAAPVASKTYRLGGLVQPGSLTWEPKTLALSFALSDGKASVPVRHKGAPPDLFAGGRGAVVEGAWTPDGYFKASLILGKHSEESKAPTTARIPGTRS
jgi:cytochrome c-type biogenesis protein CcmE